MKNPFRYRYAVIATFPGGRQETAYRYWLKSSADNTADSLQRTADFISQGKQKYTVKEIA